MHDLSLSTVDSLPEGAPEAIAGYIECALWSSTDDEGTPLDSLDAGLSDGARALLAFDVAAFIWVHPALYRAATEQPGYSPERFGHDLWLTRNGHGAGYWDRAELKGIPAPGHWGRKCYSGALSDALTQAAHCLGECDLFVGDGGYIEVG